ncbi:cell division site-positioning protein MapZ family protein [Candidatus Enterococcus mansonii]|uniref:Zinc-ribbon domain-containing protein n=1 Tax=Candidatus Enterococcus mansonii TaxID=1834181 RepID=A0A242CJJ7_9ENTE|nr:cell division site-positioning protein MapZ family protein [Enterococcus sp. 4G2_DIV0659]OTO10413.1 hypothetical protein A5880_001097 [Enterococcus sp. 4G2_DIV0659]
MTKQCPNCGNEINNQEEVCKKCGSSLKESSTSKKNEQSSEPKEQTSNFLNKDQNENIEWSEFKDMSIGHVMTMFNEQKSEEKTTSSEEKIEPTPKNEPIIENKDEKASDNLINQEIESDMLNQYINEHKNELTEEEKSATEEESLDEQPNKEELISESPLDTEDAEQNEIPSNEYDDDKTSENEELETPAKESMNKEITKFNKPEEKIETAQPIGPKSLPEEKVEIPSKSKKPEEIEMDAAPIFFKDTEEVKPSKDHFNKPESSKVDLFKSETKTQYSPQPKNYKKMSIILAAVVVLAGGTWFVYNQMQKKSTVETQVSQKQEKLISQTEKELESYFTDKSQVFIKPEMTNVSTKTIKENLDTLKNESDYKKLEAVYNKINEKQAAITKVNELFAQPIIAGNKLNDAVIKADKKIELGKREEKDGLDKLLNQATTQATDQYDQLQKAKTAVDVFYKNNEFTEALTNETYTTAKTEVDKVKSETLRKPLSDILVNADKLLKEAQAQQQAYTEQQTAQNNQNTGSSDYQGSTTQTPVNGQQPDPNGFSGPNANGVYTDPVYTVNENDVADTNNPAWIWAPGIKEKVINISIQRGYIREGAYTLYPARIINGEGYYNLYGADNQYLVTINAKTGWFKGNASRNAGR